MKNLVAVLLATLSITACHHSDSVGKLGSGGQKDAGGGSGGVAAVGGITATGTGGRIGTGGAARTGGAIGAGGLTGTGGLARTGGAMGAGGLTGRGGGVGPGGGSGDGFGTGGMSGSGGSDAGETTQPPVGYRSCDTGTAISRVLLLRIDRALGACTFILFQQGKLNCLFGLASSDGQWCIADAGIGADVTACEAFERPADLVSATGAEGTFSISFPSPLAVNADLTFRFPADGGLPATGTVQVTGCLADCQNHDCRP